MISDHSPHTPVVKRFRVSEVFPEVDFPLVASYDSMPDGEVPEHCHDFSEIVIVNSGKGYYRFGDMDYPAERGDAFVISPGERHALIACEGMALTLLLFQRAALLDQQFAHLPAFVALFDLEPLMRSTRGYQRHLRLSEECLREILEIHRKMQADLKLPQRLSAIGAGSTTRNYRPVLSGL